MFVFLLICVFCPSLVVNQDFFTVQLAPSTLTSVPYLNGEITVYEHRANQSRYYLPPLAVLQINETQVLFNRFTNRYSIRLALVLFTDELHRVVLDYLRKTLNRCHINTQCQIKMIPIDRLRIVWKRLHSLSANYELDSSWISNTILLSTIYFNIDCTSLSACLNLQEDILEYPQIIDGLELEYSTPTEKHLRRDVTILGSHVMKTNMYASLKQMHTTTESNTRYLLADDMNLLISEILANVEMSDVTDAGYVSHDDQMLIKDLLKTRIAINQEILLGHKAKQWESVYWNSDNIRPDLTVKLLNEQLIRRENQGSKENQMEIGSEKQHSNQSAVAGNTALYDDDSKTSLSTNNTAGSVYSDKSNSHATLTDTQSANLQDTASSSTSADSKQHANSGSAYSHTRTIGSQRGSAGFLFFGGSRGSSSDVTSINSNSHSTYDGSSNYNSQSQRDRFAQQQRNLDYNAGSQNKVDANYNQNYNQQGSSTNDVHARNVAMSDYTKMMDMDNFATRHLDKASLGKYEENREYLEFQGNRFEVKPVTAYRINLGQFHETLKLISKSIVVQRIDSIHAVPIRAIGEPIVLTPMLERYKINMDQKLIELNNSLLNSIEQTFMKYRQESRELMDQTLLSTTRIISKALTTDEKMNETDTDLRFLIKKALTKTMSLEDIGLFDNGILNYYRHDAKPIEKITISSLQPLKIGLHFPNIFIEGMVCDDRFDINDARVICRMINNSTSNVQFSRHIHYNQTIPACRFKTNYVNQLVPCPFIISTLECTSTNKLIQDCKYDRPLNSANRECQANEHINVSC